MACTALFSQILDTPSLKAESSDRPNIVLILADDMGYSDLGCYGGEIDTPNLDALAQGGVRFSQFYNTAKCHSSRVSLLTGQYCIAAGDTALSHGVTSAEVLGNNNYFTLMAGKWHLRKQPTDFGFQRYFGHLSGACNYFAGDNTFRLNGEPFEVPKDGFYTTVANVDYSLKFLEEARRGDDPWYLYLAFNAPHAPLHALPQDYAKYEGRYDQGWDAVRAQRIAKLKRLGVLPKDLEPSPRPEHVPAWDQLLPWQREYEAKRMATLAAMIDRLDQEVGRLVADLKQHGELENTLILFVSDNGACPYDRTPPRLDIEPTSARRYFGDSTGWSWARNGAFRYYKQNQYEGGISTPAIFHWPAGISLPAGSVVDQPAHLIDVLPTLVEVTESQLPDSWPDRQLRPISGVSLNPVLQGQSLPSRPPLHLLFASDRGLREGDWKLVSFRSGPWELYNLADDRAENHNLAADEPERLQRMVSTWHEMAEQVLHAPAGARRPVKETTGPHQHREWTNFSATEPKNYIGRRRGKKATPVKQGG
nr:arylsulfatase [Roseimaritima ulvae]